MEVETRDISVASKPVFEAQSSNEASLKQHVHQASKFVSGNSFYILISPPVALLICVPVDQYSM